MAWLQYSRLHPSPARTAPLRRAADRDWTRRARWWARGLPPPGGERIRRRHRVSSKVIQGAAETRQCLLEVGCRQPEANTEMIGHFEPATRDDRRIVALAKLAIEPLSIAAGPAREGRDSVTRRHADEIV